MRRVHCTASLLTAFGLVTLLALIASGQARKAANRAKLPTFDAAKTDRIFFPDVFARLDGERPANPNVQIAQTPAGSAGPVGGGDAPAGGSYAWSKIISGGTIENEVKAIKLATDKNITTPQDFAGRGYKEVRRDFSVLALLFAIVNEYDADVRFKKDAAAARDIFARTASNAKAGNNNVYMESKKRKDELLDLINGAALTEKAEAEENDWEHIADRSPLMQRLETAHKAKLVKWTSSTEAFSEDIEGVMHEAEMIAAIAEVLTREGMQDGDDETYAGFAKLMKVSALDIVAAVKSNNAEDARKATGEIAKACDNCHENYRQQASRRPNEQRILLGVGRLHRQRRFGWRLRLAPKLFKRLPEHNLVIAGDGPDRKSLGGLASRLGIQDRVHFAGWSPDVPSLMQAADIVLLPSRWEGMPNVLIEVMGLGLPVVATSVEGVAEILGPLTAGQAVRSEDAAGFIDTILRIVSDSVHRTKLGSANRERIQAGFSLRAMIESYEELYLVPDLRKR